MIFSLGNHDAASERRHDRRAMTMDMKFISMRSKARFLAASDHAYEGQFVTNLNVKMDRICDALIELSGGLHELGAAFAEFGRRMPERQMVLQPIVVRSQQRFQAAMDRASTGRSVTDLKAKANRVCEALIEFSGGLHELSGVFEEIEKKLPARRYAETKL